MDMTRTFATSPAAPLAPATNRMLHMPDFQLGERLTPEQLAYLETYGFIRFKRFATKEQVHALSEEVSEIDRRLVAEGRTQVNGVPLMLGARPDGTRFVQRMVFASTFGPRLHAFLQDPRFAGILEVAGPGYRIAERERDGLVINHYRREEGSAFKKLGWHTDSLRDLFYLEKPRRYLNVGFYLDDSPLTKGGVRVIPFSHQQSVWSMLTRKIHFMEHAPDPAEYAIEAEAGDLTIHDGRLWHRVAEALVTGEASQRRVMYIPLMDGPLKEKSESSRTPLYFRLKRFAKF
jgi:hypothetical protein